MGGGGCKTEMLLPLWMRLLRKIKALLHFAWKELGVEGHEPRRAARWQGDFLQSQGTCIEPADKAQKATRDQVVKGLEWWAEKCEDH